MFFNDDRIKNIHNFVNYYIEGREGSFKDKPVNTVNKGITPSLMIMFDDHNKDYNFFDLNTITDQFLANVRLKFRTANNIVRIKWSFSLINIQSSVQNQDANLRSTIFWSREVCDNIYLNDYVYFSLKREIRKSSFERWDWT